MTSSESPGELAEPQPALPEFPMEKRVTTSSSLSTPRTSQKLDWPWPPPHELEQRSGARVQSGAEPSVAVGHPQN